jgi:CheY-like chemotaxis protein
VELHGGSVAAESAGAGMGSRFTIVLPVIGIHGLDPLEARVQAGSGIRSARLLIVDDNVDAAESLSALLQAEGHAVQVIADPYHALDAALADPPDVYILDIGLPHMDGYELCRRLRAQSAGGGAIIVALSGYGQANDRALSKDAGFNYHFVKPLDMDKFHEVLASLPGC